MRRKWTSRGAVAVEAALLTPVFLVLFFGVIEWGYSFRDRLSVKDASLVGARIGSSEGNSAFADYEILQAVKKHINMPSSKIAKVVVYKASSYNASVPSACLTASQTNVCNRYVGADLDKADSYFGCDTGNIDIYWCPSDRKYALTGTYGPPDYIGVYVEAHHNNLTKLIGSGYNFKSDTIIRIEPLKLG